MQETVSTHGLNEVQLNVHEIDRGQHAHRGVEKRAPAETAEDGYESEERGKPEHITKIIDKAKIDGTCPKMRG